ncbi:MAG: hypothetical protein JXA11_02300 [Phycisphaerae bacterium]|nr:hypothetical protein [Phycisphaerae bacterium]
MSSMVLYRGNILLFVTAVVLPCSFALADETSDRLAELQRAITCHERFLVDATARLTPPDSHGKQLADFIRAVQSAKNAIDAKTSNEDIQAAFQAADAKRRILEAAVWREAPAICLLEQINASRDILPLVKEAALREKFTASLDAIRNDAKTIFAKNPSEKAVDANLVAFRQKLRTAQNELYKTTGWLAGVSSISIGRFGYQLSDGLQCETVSFDSIQTTGKDKELGRVDYDDRTISTLGCDVSFPETSVSLSVGPRGVKKIIARKTDSNWIGKTIALSSPEHSNLGTVYTTLQRLATRFSFTSPAVDIPLRKVDAKTSSVQYLSPDGWKTVPLSAKATIDGADLRNGWVLLDLVDGAPTRGDKAGQHIPVVMQFQKCPKKIVVGPEMLTMFGGGAFGDLWIFRPLGVQRPHEIRITPLLVDRIDELARMNLAWPTECDEIFNVDSAGQFVHIRDEVKFNMLEDAWDTKPLVATAVPNILMLAKRYDVPGVSITEPVTDWGVPANSGPFGTVAGATLHYTIPVPPLYHHAFFRVEKPGQDIWARRINDAIVYYGEPGKSTGDQAFRGVAYSWPARDYFNADTRKLVQKASKQISELLQPENYRGCVKWRMIPQTNRWYCYDYPGAHYTDDSIYDVDWSNGITLYGFDTWAAYGGHWDELDRAWSNAIWPLTEYLVKSHDWAWMSSTIREFGEGTSIDCLTAANSGVISLTRMARTLNRPVDAATAAYLAAKTALPHTTRFAFLEYIRKYNLWHDDSVGRGTVNGFHETNAWIHPAHSDPWWGVCSLSGFGVEPENFDTMFAYLKPAYLQKWWAMVTSMYPEWYDKDKPYPAGTLYGGNSSYVTAPGVYMEYRLGANDETLEQYIHKAGLGDGKEQNVIVYGEIANRECPVQIGSWGRCTHEKATFDPATRIARVTFINPTKNPQPVTFRCEVYPADVQLGDQPAQPTKNTDVWNQKLLHLNIPPGKHVVQLRLP